MPADTITEETIKILVDSFYQRIRSSKDLGPIFIAAIGIEDDEWKPHLERMYAFWSSVMLASGRYHGNPMQKHKNLPPFDKDMFDLWLCLFAEVAHQIHTRPIAERYIEKSRRIAESLKASLYYRSERRQA